MQKGVKKGQPHSSQLRPYYCAKVKETRKMNQRTRTGASDKQNEQSKKQRKVWADGFDSKKMLAPA